MELGDDDANMLDQVTSTEEVHAEDQEEVDRISTLPDDIAHRIMSLLPIMEIPRVAILSKRWEFLWLTFPYIDLDEMWFVSRSETVTSRKMFLQHLRKSLSRRVFNHLIMLRVNTVSPHDYELNHLVNRCVASAILRGKVQQLHLKIKNPINRLVCDHYVLPRVLFSSGSSLVSLILEDCQCGVYSKVSFPVLKKLTMKWVHVSNRLIEKVIRNSPKIETVRLEYCHGFDTLKVSNPKLRCLILNGCKELVAFEMDTPSLNYFRCDGIRRFFRRSNLLGDLHPDYDYSDLPQFKASNTKTFSSLKTLVLSLLQISDQTFQSILSTFPDVEKIELLSTALPKIPSMLFAKLKSVEIQNCHFNELVEFNAPNLETLIYKGGKSPNVLRCSGGMGLYSLKTVSLVGYDGLKDDSLVMLLSCCIRLENLEVKTCGMLGHMRVISSTLKSLVVHSCYRLVDGEIQAPELEYFEYVGKLIQFSSIISSVNLDVELYLEKTFYDNGYAQQIRLRKLIRNFEQARVITLNGNRTDNVVFPEEVATPVPPLPFLPHLKVKAGFARTSLLRMLLGALSLAHCRETLWMNVENTTLVNVENTTLMNVENTTLLLKFQEIKEARDKEFSQVELQTHDCIQQHLTEVRLENFNGSGNQMQLVTYLLQNARLLNSLYIKFSWEVRKCASTRSELINRIIYSPRASGLCQTTFR